MRFFAAVAVFLTLTLLTAVADDPSPGDLEAAKKSYEKASADARSALTKGFENAESAIRNRTGITGEKKLAALKELADEKASFADIGKLPDSGEMRTYVTEFKEAAGRAETELLREYDKHIGALSKNGELEKASALLAEKKAFAQEAFIRRNKAEFSALLGRWSIKTPPTDYEAVWTFTPDGYVNSTAGDSLKATWKYDRARRLIVISWEGVNITSWFGYPVKPDGTMSGGTSQDRKYRVLATKLKDS
jgi:hypothetical protein